MLFLIIALIILGPLSFFLLRSVYKNILLLRTSGRSRSDQLMTIVSIILAFIPGAWFILFLAYIFFRAIF